MGCKFPRSAAITVVILGVFLRTEIPGEAAFDGRCSLAFSRICGRQWRCMGLGVEGALTVLILRLRRYEDKRTLVKPGDDPTHMTCRQHVRSATRVDRPRRSEAYNSSN